MNSDRKTFRIKLIVLIIGLIMILLVFSINKFLINKLRNQVHQQVELLAKSYSEAINSSNEDDISFVMDILLPSLDFPIIITSDNEISSIMNLDVDFEPENKKSYNNLWNIVDGMDKDFKPFDLKWNGVVWGKIHFSDPKLINQLKWMPFIELACGILFIFVFLWAFKIIRQSERNLIYVGMAKETAHQLGTPISSLMGWLDLLNKNKSDKSLIIKSMDEDIIRLKDISERFSKIGSTPQLKKIDIYHLISNIINYMESRLPKKSKISLELNSEGNTTINGDNILLFWAIENLIKNSLDALIDGEGIIRIDIKDKYNDILIAISDSGRGINRKKWSKVFDPGYSTKIRGWGLGLSLSSRIINEIHNGEIYLYRSNPGETIFHIILKK